MTASADWSLYAITPEDLKPDALMAAVEEALAGGVTIVQVRRKERTTRDLLKETEQIIERSHRYGATVIVNDRVDVTLAAGAHGVHLGQKDLPVEHARRMLGSRRIIGVSAHNPEEALAARREGADYVAVGPVFATPSKRTGPAIGIQGVAAAKHAVGGPLVAIGGILPEHVTDLIRSGVSGVAVISGLFGSPSIQDRAREYIAAIRSAQNGLAAR